MSKKQDFSAIGAFITPPTTQQEDRAPEVTISESKTKSKSSTKKATPAKRNNSLSDDELRKLLQERGYKLSSIEPKTKRLNLLIQPSLYEKAREKAQEEGISTNLLIENAIRKYIEEA